MEKVLFLDVDGVLNNKDSKALLALSKPALRRLQKITEETNCHVIVSSTWRLWDYAYSRLLRALRYRDIEVAGVTPRLDTRGLEIDAWLKQNLYTGVYAILDDDTSMLDDQLPNFFQTDFDVGLTDEIAQEVIRHLNSAAK